MESSLSVLDPSSRRLFVQTMPDTIPGVSPIKGDEGYYLEGVLAPDLLFAFKRGEGADIITRVPAELLEPYDC